MIDHTEDRFGVKPGWLVGDTEYGSAEDLAWFAKKARDASSSFF